jgi:hypothetical protein
VPLRIIANVLTAQLSHISRWSNWNWVSEVGPVAAGQERDVVLPGQPTTLVFQGLFPTLSYYQTISKPRPISVLPANPVARGREYIVELHPNSIQQPTRGGKRGPQRAASKGLQFVNQSRRALSPKHKKNSRSLHCATPDFLSNSVTLLKFLRLSLRRAAYVVVVSAAK